MCRGERRALTVPASLAYGDRGAGGGLIPPGATLHFVVDLISVRDGPPIPVDPCADPPRISGPPREPFLAMHFHLTDPCRIQEERKRKKSL